jgi:tetratricopeptide (TPR) repeat protein
MSVHNDHSYYLKALDAYPMHLEEASEALGYALSYNGEHAGALYLQARLYAGELNMPGEAIQYFEETLLADDRYLPAYFSYAILLINRRKYEKATKLLDKVWNIPGCDRARVLYLKAWLAETDMRFKDALNLLDEARLYCTCNYQMRFLDEEGTRITNKKVLQKKLKKSKKDSKQTDATTESRS